MTTRWQALPSVQRVRGPPGLQGFAEHPCGSDPGRRTKAGLWAPRDSQNVGRLEFRANGQSCPPAWNASDDDV